MKPERDYKSLEIQIDMFDKLDNYREEDIAKSVWPYLVPFLTRRHGVDKGEINLSDGAIVITWKYTDTYEETYPYDDYDL